MINIYLIRHGDKIRASGDVSLSVIGKSEAQKTGNFFKDKNIDLILSSPQKRAVQTATIIKNILKSPPLKFNPLLKERINFGDVPEQGYVDFLEMVEKSSIERDWILPNGESSISAGRRMEDVIGISALGTYKNILIITHGGIISDFLRNAFSAGELNKKVPDFSVKRETAIKTCSITEIQINGNNISLIEIANISHLL